MARDITRVTVNLNAELVNRVDAYAEKMNINRTSAIAVLLSMAIDGQEVVANMPDIIKLYKKSVDGGVV